MLAPLATELPEKANSVLWVRAGKDSLALGNVTGAMVFQATIPVAFGMLGHAVGSSTASAVAAACLGLAGGTVALWALRGQRFGLAPSLAAPRPPNGLGDELGALVREGRAELAHGARAPAVLSVGQVIDFVHAVAANWAGMFVLFSKSRTW